MGLLDAVLRQLGYTKAQASMDPSALYAPPGFGTIPTYPLTFPGWNALDNKLTEAAQARIATHSAWVYADIQVIARLFSAGELEIVTTGADGMVKATNHPMEALWMTPNAFMSSVFLMQFQCWQLSLRGRCYWFIATRDDEPAELWPVPVDFLTPDGDATTFISRYIFKTRPDAKPIYIDPHYIVYTRLPNPFDPRGSMSPLEAAWLAIETDQAQARWSRDFFSKENAIPSAVISLPPTTNNTDFARFKQELFDYFGGGKRRTMVARGGDVKVEQMMLGQRDMEFLAGREFSRDEIDRVFNFPSGYWNRDASRANSDHAEAAVIGSAVWPLLVMVAADFTLMMRRWYGPQYRAQFKDIRSADRDMELRTLETHKTFKTINELRKDVGLEPLTDERGDKLPVEISGGGKQPAAAQEPETAVIAEDNLTEDDDDPDDDEGLDEADGDETSAKHLPGKHDQSVHGKGGRGKQKPVGGNKPTRLDDDVFAELLGHSDKPVKPAPAASGGMAYSRLTPEAKKSIGFYQGFGFADINIMARNGRADDDDDEYFEAIQQKTRHIDAAIARGPRTKKAMTLYRAVSYDVPIKEGEVFRDKAYLSTSRKQNVVENPAFLGKEHGTLFKIAMPAGAPALDMDKVKAIGEQEMLLPRESGLKVTKISYRKERDGRVTKIIQADYVPPDPLFGVNDTEAFKAWLLTLKAVDEPADDDDIEIKYPGEEKFMSDEGDFTIVAMTDDEIAAAWEHIAQDDNASNEDDEEKKHLQSKHNQKDHGRGTARRQAYQDTYRQARADGKDRVAARALGKEASAQHKHPSGGGGGGLVQTVSPRAPETNNAAARTTHAFGSDPNRTYEFKHKVVSLDDLILSNTDNGDINPAYDATLQPRQRDRAASQMQIDHMAKTLVPESMLWDFHQIDKGAPIIGDDGMVESGNGRTLALRRARDQHPDQYTAYQKKMREQLHAAGLSDADLKGVKDPVLVRERVTKVDRTQFAREANAPPVLQMSPLENARVDAKRVTDASLQRLEVKDDQSMDLALRSANNRAFVRDFMTTLPENERAVLMRADGSLNQMGIWRIKAAVFKRVFPGEAGDRMADTFLEGLDSTTKNFENAISGTLPNLARAESLMNSGQRHRQLSLSEDMSKSLNVLARLREQGMAVDVYLEQSSMFERELSGDQERLLKHFDTIGRSPKKVREFLTRYGDEVEKSSDPNQVDLFGDGPPTKERLLDTLLSGDA